jgi:hypothetical protein
MQPSTHRSQPDNLQAEFDKQVNGLILFAFICWVMKWIMFFQRDTKRIIPGSPELVCILVIVVRHSNIFLIFCYVNADSGKYFLPQI